MRTREEIKKALELTFKQEFPTDTVDISDGYASNIHILVVSRRFDDMPDAIQRDMMWHLIGKAGLDESEKALISMTLALSPADIK